MIITVMSLLEAPYLIEVPPNGLLLHKLWPAVLDKIIAYIVIKICHCIAIKIYFVLLW